MPKTPADIAAREPGLVSTFIKDYLVGAEIPPLVFFVDDRKIHEKAKPTRYRCYLRLLACSKELWPIRRCLAVTIYDMDVPRPRQAVDNALYLGRRLGATYRVKYMHRVHVPLVLAESGRLVDGFCYAGEACTLADLVREYKKTSPQCSRLVRVSFYNPNSGTLTPLWSAANQELAPVFCKDAREDLDRWLSFGGLE